MKKPEILIRDYVGKLNEDNLKFLNSRLGQRLSGDLPEALNFLSGNHEMDRYLASAKTCDDLYEMTDLIEWAVGKECDRRWSD